MRGLANFIMAGRLQAVTAAVGFAVLALFLPPASLLSGAVVALVTLRLGLGAGLTIAALGMAALVAMGAVTGLGPQFGVLIGLAQWLAPLVFAEVLRRTVSWRLTLQGLLMATVLLVSMAHLVWPEQAVFWRSLLEQFMAPGLAEGGLTPTQIEEALEGIAGVMGGIIGLSLMLSTALALIIGRYWQAALYNPGGFGEEFRELRLGLWPAGLALGLIIAAMLAHSPLVGQLALVVVAMFIFQGLALVHGLARLFKWHAGWLVALYVLLVLPPFSPYAVAMITAFGVIDSFADFRARVGAAPRDDE
jgi:hypothetical protein